MTRNQTLFNLLKNQAQNMFWLYEAKSEKLASPVAISAYKLSFSEFLQFAVEQFHLKKIDQIRKKHIDAYVRYLQSENNHEYMVSKRVYAICFWIGMIEDKPERFPCFESFGLAHPANIKLKP